MATTALLVTPAYKFDWYTDDCPVPKEVKNGTIWKVRFLVPCARHDFGYANARKLASSEKWKSQYNKTVDKAFYKDVLRACVRRCLHGGLSRLPGRGVGVLRRCHTRREVALTAGS
ncbi:phospholipase A2 [Nonomuraea sp. 3N208]|uniref:phospholipase A2 n=1 Tax=Nonomuraea sp. 3N208 TaxID=3457421 RepID=UPI003FD59FAC